MVNKISTLAIVLSVIFAISCKNDQNEERNQMKDAQKLVKPPVAKKIPKELELHDDLRIDNYYWLNDRENPDVIKYLEQENAFYDAMTAHTTKFQEDLFEEMKSRIKKKMSRFRIARMGFITSRVSKPGSNTPYTLEKGQPGGAGRAYRGRQ